MANVAPAHRDVLIRYSNVQSEGQKLGIGFVLTALKSCRELKDLEFGKKIHREAVASGDISNVLIANTLLDMYVKNGSLDTALSLFEGMRERSVVSWTTMIMGYAHSDHAELALELYERMQNEGCEPDRVTLLAALKACAVLARKERGELLGGKLRCLATARRLYFQTCQAGYQMNTSVGNSLIDMFAKCGNLVDARKHFDCMEKRNLVSWNCIILGYAQNGEGLLALELYALMQEQGYRPNEVTLLGALKACASMAENEEGTLVEGKVVKVTSLDSGRKVHSQAVACKGCALGTALVDMYVKCGSVEEARRIFDELQPRNMIACTALMLGYVQNGDFHTALGLFAGMLDDRYAPDALTFVAALKACSGLAETEEAQNVGGRLVKLVALQTGRSIHSQAAGRGLADVVLANTLMDMYSKCGSMRDARHVFEAMTERSIVSWNCILMGCIHNGEPETALELFHRMQKSSSSSSPPPDAVTFTAAVKACAALAALDAGKQIEAEVCNAGLEAETMVANSLIDLYGKCSKMSEAERVFAAIPRRDVVTWSCLIAGYSSKGDVQRVFELFERMQAEERLRPDGVTFLALLAACSSAGLASKAKEYFALMQTVYGVTPSIEHYNCMLDLLARVGQFQDAAEIVESMPYHPDGWQQGICLSYIH